MNKAIQQQEPQGNRVNGSAFSQEEEDELQRLVRKIKWNQPTYEDMKKADELTRKKWKSQGIG